MNTYTDASLIVTPNAKKAGKLYALKGADLDVVRATTATYVGADGLIKTAGINEPRFDYSNGSCPSILVEPQRTNLVFPSATATTQTRTVTATEYTLSFYGTGTVTLSGVATGSLVGTGANNKVELTFTPTAGSLILTVIGSVNNWQLEQGSNATSYIPTTTTAVTRNADVISKNGISDLIGQTEGTIYCEFERSIDFSGNKHPFVLFSNYTTNYIWLGCSTTSIQVLIVVDGVNYFSVITMQDLNKIAIVYSDSGTKVFFNGILAATISNIGVPPMSSLYLGQRLNSRFWNSGINSFMLWKTQISDEQAIQLTTL